MACYLVGDIQGCLDELKQLLDDVGFDPAQDELWLTGDLVARGPKSLETLRYVRDLGPAATVVLGNHDLHLLTVSSGLAREHDKDRLQPLLAAPDRDELLRWLRFQPLLAEHSEYPLVMTHAGIPPAWDLTTARQCARQIEAELQSVDYFHLLKGMYGNQPDQWDDNLSGIERLRYSINALTRMRFCYPDGRLEFHHKLMPSGNHPELVPWFELPAAYLEDKELIFGHWAALEGHCGRSDYHALDTGCVWGNTLTMLRWEDKQRFSTACPTYAQ
ncbi:symmetrical bis(5'-nucleosyl)-tetraphosphatase [Dongshaea marina]|uniref:symmetrical bis(5'-nucleosyl)-tetraphosphatase n=1 Tax=Dongshaea marina TaxID=2047966 RepID=UPI000D3E3C83|nr:symmetrical bis(5'-nucleosyl)-tetraphosphatase [Dongshaea marina]